MRRDETNLLTSREVVSRPGKFLDRTARMLDAKSLHRLRIARLVIAGCGGLGGAVALTMARLGVGQFVLADPGRFDEPDINRQWGADESTLGQNKAEAYRDWLQRINPEVEVEIHTGGVTWDNVDELAAGGDVVIDCLDVSVDMRLRDRLFQQAHRHGVYSLTAPVLGFGTFIAIASPQGLSMEPVTAVLRQTTLTAQLPEFVRDFYAPLCVQALERDLPTGKLPSLSIGPTVAGALVSTELLLILLKGHLTPWREPICLPRVLMMDTFTASYRIGNLPELLGQPRSPAPANGAFPPGPIPARERQERLRSAHFNTNLLPPSSVAIDLLTDSWGERPAGMETPSEPSVPTAEERIREIYGYDHVLAVTRGRFAEALLATALIRPGDRVAGNALFPSTRFHVESRGAALLDLSGQSAGADIDLQHLAALIAEHPARPLACVWLEACCNALGGAALSLASLRAVHELCRPAGIPVVLDATRLLENVLLCQEAPANGKTLSPLQLLHEFTRCADACAFSAMKDFPIRHGGFVATHSEAIHGRLRDLLLAFGNSLSDEQRRTLAAALPADPFAAPADRLRLVRKLHRELRGLDVPLLEPCGGHAVVIDADRLLPHLKTEQHPGQALANTLYLLAGARGSLHWCAESQQGRELVRLAIPIASVNDSDLRPVVEALAVIRRQPDQAAGLRKVLQPAGAMGSLFAHYQPIQEMGR